MEYRQAGTFAPERLPITLAALAACEGSKATDTIEFSRHSDTLVVARWSDRHVPQSLIVDIPAGESEPPPQQLEAWAENSPQLISALADAMEVTDSSSTRYSLNCVQLRGSEGRIAATDSSQLLVQHGFQFPWDGEALIPRTTLFKQKDLWSANTIRIGRTTDQLVMNSGPWTVWLPIQKEGRFPLVENIIPPVGSASTRMVLEEHDVDFFLNTVPLLPCDETSHRPVTVELNGHVALLAQAGSAAPVTRAILRNARREGDELRWLTNRDYLLRAVRLGFREVELRGNEAPAVCRDDHRVFVWSVLSPQDAIVATEGAVDVLSPDVAAPQVASIPVSPESDAIVPQRRERPSRSVTNRVAATFAALDSAPSTGSRGSTSYLAHTPPELADSLASVGTLLQEAESLKAALSTAHVQIGRLIARLESHSRQPQLA